MNFQQPPVFSELIPMQAQALVMDPNALNMLKFTNHLDLISLFYFQLPFMMLPKDDIALKKTGKKLISLVGGGLLAGFIANVQIKRINKNFLKWPFYVRFPIRFAVMALPFALLYPQIESKTKEIIAISESMTARKNELVLTKDIFKYFSVQKPTAASNKKK